MSSTLICLVLPLGKVSKTPVTEIVREGGGVPPLSVNFFPLGFLEPTVREGGGGVPPLSVKKKSIKNWPKNSVFWAKNAVFGEKISVFGHGPSVKGGGEYPPFPLTFFR